MAEDVATQQGPEEPVPDERGADLCAWIMAKVRPWRDHRDSKHRAKWEEYQRIWRGEWAEEDKQKKSERSKIVTPATMNAVDSTVSEIQEAVFGREAWFDMDEDIDEINDPGQRQEVLAARDRLREYMDDDKVPSACAKVFLIGAVYGTGIAKVDVVIKDQRSMQTGQDGTRTIRTVPEARCELVPLEPFEFVPDPTSDDIEKMLGCAHETIMPFHLVRQGMVEGRYRATEVSKWAPTVSDPTSKGGTLFTSETNVTEGVKITEWHGKVPGKYLVRYLEPNDPTVAAMADDADEDELLVEAIVTIANESKTIGAKSNPFVMRDRSIIAYQHDTVPGYFWGRGVVEKAYNPQKAADASIRARIDTLAFVANPMMSGDISRLPRGMNLGVWPGKFWATTGDPGEVLSPLQFGNIVPELFPHAEDMERMVMSATGAMDQSANYSADSGAQKTALVHSSFVKKARRTMQNIEQDFLRPMVRKFMWRYVQFSQAFPKDYKMTVRGTLGVMAREIEQQQLTQLLSLVPNESKPFMAITKAIFDNSSSPHKADVLKSIDEMLHPEMTPEQQQKAKMMEDLAMRGQVATVEELEAKALKAKAEAQRAVSQAQLFQAEAENIPVQTHLEGMGHVIDAREVAAFEHQNKISEDQLALRGMDTVIKAAQVGVALKKVENEGRKISKDG